MKNFIYSLLSIQLQSANQKTFHGCLLTLLHMKDRICMKIDVPNQAESLKMRFLNSRTLFLPDRTIKTYVKKNCQDKGQIS